VINFAVYFNGNGYQNIWFKDILQGNRKKQTNINNQKISYLVLVEASQQVPTLSFCPRQLLGRNKGASKQNPQINQSEIAS